MRSQGDAGMVAWLEGHMRRSVIHESRAMAGLILWGGFVLYTELCYPALTRRGYPEIAPFYLAIPWLWPVPVILSAPFEALSWKRVLRLFIYGFVAAVFMEGCSTDLPVPRHPNLDVMLFMGPLIWGPIHLAGTAVTEAIARFVLRYIRVFAPGSETSAGAPSVIPSRNPVRAFYGLVLVGAVAFPFVYHWADLALARQRGEQWAEHDWAAGKGYLMISSDQRDWDSHVLWPQTYDPHTGLQVLEIEYGAVLRTEYEAYRRVIEKKVARYGPAPLAKCLFTPEELASLLKKAKFERVLTFPFKYGHLTINADGSVSRPSDVAGGGSGEAAPFMYRAVVADKCNVMVLVEERGFTVIHPDGRVLQWITHRVTEDMIGGRN